MWWLFDPHCWQNDEEFRDTERIDRYLRKAQIMVSPLSFILHLWRVWRCCQFRPPAKPSVCRTIWGNSDGVGQCATWSVWSLHHCVWNNLANRVYNGRQWQHGVLHIWEWLRREFPSRVGPWFGPAHWHAPHKIFFHLYQFEFFQEEKEFKSEPKQLAFQSWKRLPLGKSFCYKRQTFLVSPCVKFSQFIGVYRPHTNQR